MDKLIFVYNADSGILNSLKDWAHKIISPETYPCSLGALTYDNLGMRCFQPHSSNKWVSCNYGSSPN